MSREPQKLLEEIAVFIMESRKLLENGEIIQLAGMDRQIRALCDEVMSLNSEQRRQYAEPMKKLFDEVKQLGDTMESTRADLLKEIRGVSNHQKANVAYQTSDSLDRRSKQEDQK